MYNLIFSDNFKKQLKKLEKDIQKRIISVLERSRIRPHHFFIRLVGERAYKLRVGDYRVIADILDDKLAVLVLQVGHRKNIYKI